MQFNELVQFSRRLGEWEPSFWPFAVCELKHCRSHTVVRIIINCRKVRCVRCLSFHFVEQSYYQIWLEIWIWKFSRGARTSVWRHTHTHTLVDYLHLNKRTNIAFVWPLKTGRSCARLHKTEEAMSRRGNIVERRQNEQWKRVWRSSHVCGHVAKW